MQLNLTTVTTAYDYTQEILKAHHDTEAPQNQ